VLCGKRLGTSVSGLGTDGVEDSLRKRISTIGLAAPLFLLATLVPVDDVVVRIGPQCFPSLHWHGSGTGMFPSGDYASCVAMLDMTGYRYPGGPFLDCRDAE